jgi:hypothetical protein
VVEWAASGACEARGGREAAGCGARRLPAELLCCCRRCGCCAVVLLCCLWCCGGGSRGSRSLPLPLLLLVLLPLLLPLLAALGLALAGALLRWGCCCRRGWRRCSCRGRRLGACGEAVAGPAGMSEAAGSSCSCWRSCSQQRPAPDALPRGQQSPALAVRPPTHQPPLHATGTLLPPIPHNPPPDSTPCTSGQHSQPLPAPVDAPFDAPAPALAAPALPSNRPPAMVA